MTPYSLARMMIKNVGGRVKHCLKIFSIVFLLFVLAWGVSVLLILGVTSGRVFGTDARAAGPARRAGGVLVWGKTLPSGRDNLYYLRRIAAAAELYRSGKVR